MQTLPAALNVHVSYEEGYWIASCDRIGLVTEAKTYDELIARCRLIAPELAELNGVANYQDLNLHYHLEEPIQVE
jgi:hypothetical protein